MKRQSGVSLLIVIVIVALTTLIAAQLIEHSGYTMRRTQLFLGKEQAYQLALGGEELAKIWLAKGFADAKGGDPVHLDQPWATTPMEFPIEGGMIKATVSDAQACFNLNTLGEEPLPPAPGATPQQPGAKQLPSHQIFEDFLQGVLEDVEITPKALTEALVDWVDQNIEPTGSDGAEDLEYTGYQIPYRTANNLMANKSELRVIKGFNAKVYDNIKDYVCVLPFKDENSINVNTVAAEHAALLKGFLGNVNVGDISTALAKRTELESGYESKDNFLSEFDQQVVEKIPDEIKERIAITSNHFFVNMNIEYRGANYKMGSLMKRPDDNKQPFKVIARYFGDY